MSAANNDNKIGIRKENRKFNNNDHIMFELIILRLTTAFESAVSRNMICSQDSIYNYMLLFFINLWFTK